MDLHDGISSYVFESEFLQAAVTTDAADPTCVRLVLTGEVERTTAPELLTAMDDVLTRYEPTSVAVDLAEVTFLDSSGIHCLLTCRARALRTGTRMRIVEPSRMAYQVLDVTGLLETFDIRPQADRQPGAPGSVPVRLTSSAIR